MGIFQLVSFGQGEEDYVKDQGMSNPLARGSLQNKDEVTG